MVYMRIVHHESQHMLLAENLTSFLIIKQIIILMTTCSFHIEEANHNPRFNIKQGM